jgi:small subunit ribosomal protein S1
VVHLRGAEDDIESFHTKPLARVAPTMCLPLDSGPRGVGRRIVTGEQNKHMVDRTLIRNIDVSDADVEAALAAEFDGGYTDTTLEGELGEAIGHVDVEGILKGRVIRIGEHEVLLDVGLKSEGVVATEEWDDIEQLDVGDEIEVLLEDIDPDTGIVLLSKRRADRVLNWKRIVEECSEGDIVKGRATRKIKGGLLVDIGVPVFLPASQVDIRRPADIGEFIDQEVEAKILRIDTERRNIVISRRKLIEEQRAEAKTKLMSEIEVGQLRTGVVKNIADFGAFVDLGGIDGLLHITDMSWDPHRASQPDAQASTRRSRSRSSTSIANREKIALGLKQKTDNPWESVDEGRYPVNSRVKRRGRQHRQLRRVREARSGHRGPGPHLRDELDPAHQSPDRTAQRR